MPGSLLSKEEEMKQNYQTSLGIWVIWRERLWVLRRWSLFSLAGAALFSLAEARITVEGVGRRM